MRLSSSTLLAALLAPALYLPAQVTAQTIPSAFTYVEHRQEAGLFSGYTNAETGRFGFGPSGGLRFGGHYGLDLSGPLSLEANVGFVSGTRDIVNPARVIDDQVVGQGDVLLTSIDGRLRFSFAGDRAWHGFSPFIGFGGGVVFDAASAPAEEADLEPADVFDFGNSFHGTATVGTRWFLTDTFALRLDGLFSLWSIDTPPGFSDPARAFENVEESEWMSGLSFSVALLYRW